MYDAVCGYQSSSDAGHWSPAPLLEKLAKSGGSFRALASAENSGP